MGSLRSSRTIARVVVNDTDSEQSLASRLGDHDLDVPGPGEHGQG
jgi:hypothetical protein